MESGLKLIVRLGFLTAAAVVWILFVFGMPKSVAPELGASDDAQVIRGVILPQTPEMAIPTAITVAGSLLVVLDRYDDEQIVVLDRETGRHLYSLGARGEGPGEMMAAWSMDTRGDTLTVLDAQLQRVSRYDLAMGSQLSQERLPELGPAMAIAELPRGCITLRGIFGDLPLALVCGSDVRLAGELPPSDTEAPPNILLHAYQSHMQARPDRQRLVSATRQAGWIEIHDGQSNQIRRFVGPFGFEPAFNVASGASGLALRQTNELRFGYVGLAATQEWIYGLFSGRLWAAHGADASKARSIHMFDWEGELVDILELPRDAVTIAVSEDGMLYAIEYEPEPRILMYKLTGQATG